MFRNNRFNRNINNRRIQNPQLRGQQFSQGNNQWGQLQNSNFNQQSQNSGNINNFNNIEELQQQGISVLPFDENNKEEVLGNSNNIQGNVVFATDEFKENFLNDNKIKEEKNQYKDESIKKVKFEISEIYKNELNRKNFYNSMLKNCKDNFSKNNINYILKNCDKLFSVYEKERFFKSQMAYVPKTIEVQYNKGMILYAIEEEHNLMVSLLNEFQNSWDYSKLNRILIIKLHDLSILNSMLANI